MGMRLARGTALQRVGNACQRSMEERWLRGQRSAKIGIEIGTETEGGATGTETGVENGTGTGSTRGNVGRGTGVNGERNVMPPHEMTLAPKTKCVTRMIVHRPIWRSTVRTE